MANTIKTTDGIEVYESKVYILCDEYINTLNNSEDIYNNPSLFT